MDTSCLTQWMSLERFKTTDIYKNGGDIDFELLFGQVGKYEGQLLDTKPHGVGRSVTDSAIYEGEHKSGSYHGFGRLITSESIYTGMFDDGLKHGLGSEVNKASGETREGTWELGFYKEDEDQDFGDEYDSEDEKLQEELEQKAMEQVIAPLSVEQI